MQKHSGQAPCEEDTSSRIGQVIIQYVEQAKDHLAIERRMKWIQKRKKKSQLMI